MMRGNFCGLIGRATRDAEIKEVGSTKVCTIRLAVNERVKKRDGTWEDKPMYIDCEAWGSRAEYAEKHVKRGSSVFVLGALEQDEWVASDGTKRSKHKVYVRYDLQVDYQLNKELAGDGDGVPAGASSSDDNGLPF